MIKPELSSLFIAAIHAKYDNGKYVSGNKIRLLNDAHKVVDEWNISVDSFGVSANAKLFPFKAEHNDKAENLEIKYESPVLKSYWSIFNARKCLDSDCCVDIKVFPSLFDSEDEDFNIIKKLDLTILNNIALKDLGGGYSRPVLGCFNCYIDMDIFSPMPILTVNDKISLSMSFPDFVVSFPELKAIHNGVFQEGWDLIEKVHCVATCGVSFEFKKPFLAAAENSETQIFQPSE